MPVWAWVLVAVALAAIALALLVIAAQTGSTRVRREEDTAKIALRDARYLHATPQERNRMVLEEAAAILAEERGEQ